LPPFPGKSGTERQSFDKVPPEKSTSIYLSQRGTSVIPSEKGMKNEEGNLFLIERNT